MKKYIILIVLLTIGISACATIRQKGKQLDRQIRVDGLTDEWQDNLAYDEDTGVMTGFYYDDENIYICFTTSKRQIINQVMRQGMTIWFDPDGGRGKEVGIRFPVIDRADLGQERANRLSGQTQDFHHQPMPAKEFKEIKRRMNKFELLRGDDDSKLLIIFDETPGFSMMMEMDGGVLALEMSVPFKGSGMLPPIVEEGRTSIDLGFTTPDLNEKMGRNMNTGQQGFNNPGGAGFQGRGGRAGGMSQKPGMGRVNMPEPLNKWVSVDISGDTQAD